MPGVPDVYQGNETWQFSLVDPDNRRPVDYRTLQRALDDLAGDYRDRADLAGELLAGLADGRAKLYVTAQALALRKAHPALFLAGDYAAVDALGPRAEHLCAFARRHGDEELLVAAGRWYARLTGEDDAPPVAGTWAGTRLALPAADAGCRYRNLLDGRLTVAHAGEDGPELELADVFAHLPVALLLRE